MLKAGQAMVYTGKDARYGSNSQEELQQLEKEAEYVTSTFPYIKYTLTHLVYF